AVVVEGELHAFVDLAVAVVVHVIADLDGGRIDGHGVVVTVGAAVVTVTAHGVGIRVAVGVEHTERARIAVLVETGGVAALGCAGIAARIAVVTVEAAARGGFVGVAIHVDAARTAALISLDAGHGQRTARNAGHAAHRVGAHQVRLTELVTVAPDVIA